MDEASFLFLPFVATYKARYGMDWIGMRERGDQAFHAARNTRRNKPVGIRLSFYGRLYRANRVKRGTS